MTTNTAPWRAILFAGLIGQIAFEVYAWLLSPLLFGPALEPANLVIGISQMFLGVTLSYWAAFALHFAIGVFVFGGAVWALKTATRVGWYTSGVVVGLALWFVAQGILAPLMGRDFMMGFGAYTQSSFVSHVGMTVVMAAVFKSLIKPSDAQSIVPAA